MKFDSEANVHQKFMETMHDAVLILDENYNILYFNQVAGIWYGYNEDEFKKLNLQDIRAPGERGKIIEHMNAVAKEKGAVWETVHMRKDGTEFPVEVSSTPIEVGTHRRYYHVVRDISERKKHEETLRASEERYKHIVEFSPETIFIHRDGKVIFINSAGLKLFGATDPAQIIGQSIWNLYPPERHGIVRSRNQLMEKTREPAPLIEHTILRVNGERMSVEATACIIDYAGEPAFYVIFRDITERKKNRTLLDLQYAVARHLIESPNMIEANKHVLESICDDLKFDLGKLWVIDKKDQVLRLISSWATDEELLNDNSKVHVGLANKVQETSQPYWIDNSDSAYKTNIALPVMTDKELLGVLEFASQKSMPRDETVLQTLAALGDQIALFLKRKKFEKDLAYIAKHDPITGLSNRSFFEEILAYELKLVKNKDQILAVIFIDIDNFSAYNEALGHAAGDELLKAIAARLLKLNIASENLGRFGPQFAIILSGIATVEDVTSFIKEINIIMAEELIVQEQHASVTFNYGVAMYPDDGDDVDSLLRSASIALSSAKETGNGVVQFCTVDLNIRAQKRIKMENDLRNALHNEEFFLQYQPIIDTRTMTTSGFESLIRWNKDNKNISPAEFIPLAEKSKLIIPIGEWLMRSACLQCKEWQALVKRPIFISVNISPIQFKSSSVLDMIVGVIKETNFDPTCLKVEVTESALMDNTKKSINTLHAIRDLGVKISIDDFGTGYSSLNYLRHLPVDFLKIDQSFVRNMTTDPNDAAIVKTIIDLAENLRYNVIAEGVETQEQLNFLTTLGCYNIQGYYFSPPLQVADATIFLQQGSLLR